MASIEKRSKPGSWRITISNGYDAQGKKNRFQRSVMVDPNKTELAQRREVERIAAALETDYRRHLLTDSKIIKFSDVCNEYLEYHDMGESTKQWYESMFKRIRNSHGTG